MESQISSLFGGRIAEEMIFGPDGHHRCLQRHQRATEIARNMVTKWGLSEKMGPLLYDEGGEEVFLGCHGCGKGSGPQWSDRRACRRTLALDCCPGRRGAGLRRPAP
jgi:ATP-dependent Zn protease